MSLPTLTPRRLALGAVLAMGLAAPAFVVPALAAPAANAAPTTNEQAETAAVQAAHVAPEAAIRAAEAKAGGRAISFGLEHTATLNAYEVLVASSAGALSKVDVNPTTGAATMAGPAGPNAVAADGLPASAIGQAAGAQTPLADAVQSAEAAGQGRALEGGYTLDQGRLAVSVDVVGANGGSRTFGIDAQSGKPIQLAQLQTQESDQEANDSGHGGQHEGNGPDHEHGGQDQGAESD